MHALKVDSITCFRQHLFYLTELNSTPAIKPSLSVATVVVQYSKLLQPFLSRHTTATGTILQRISVYPQIAIYGSRWTMNPTMYSFRPDFDLKECMIFRHLHEKQKTH